MRRRLSRSPMPVGKPRGKRRPASCAATLTDYMHAARLYRRASRPGDAARSDASAVDCLSNLGRFTEALRLAARARRVFRRQGESLRSAVLDEIIGLVYFRQDDHARAYYAAQGADAGLGRVDLNLAGLAYRQGRYGAAIDLHRRAGDVFDRLNSPALAVLTRLELAETYLALNLLDEAAALSQEQLMVACELGLPNEQARAQFN